MTIVTSALNRLGLPVRAFGLPLVLGATCASLVYCLIRRPHVDWKRAAVWAGALVFALLVVGWPMLVGGLDWIGFGNGDMGTYLLGADHFFRHGFYQLPNLRDLLHETDPSWDDSFYYSIGEVRSGSQMILALLMAASSLTAAQGYMSLVLALHLTMLCAAAALVCGSSNRERVALLAFLMIASSAELADGTINNLMPQDFGLAALAACVVLLLDRPLEGRRIYAQAALGGVFVATLLLAYPEMLPFLILALAMYGTVAALKGIIPFRRWLLVAPLVCSVTLALANAAVPGALHLLLWAGRANSGGAITSIFPYYMTPFGFALGWGFAPLGSGDYSTWLIQAGVVAGMLLYIAAAIVCLRGIFRLSPIASVGATMLLLFPVLFATDDAFGMMKLAMYAQPFVLGALAIAVGDILKASPTVGRATA